MRPAKAAAVSSLGLLLAACADGSSSAGVAGDCSPSIGFRGVVYVFNTGILQSAPRGTALGPGSALDCDQKKVLEPAEIVGLKGIDAHQAIGVVGGAQELLRDLEVEPSGLSLIVADGRGASPCLGGHVHLDGEPMSLPLVHVRLMDRAASWLQGACP